MGTVDFLCIAVLVDDIKEPVNVGSIHIKAGSLDTVRGKPTLTRKEIESAHYGGGGNIAPVAKTLGVRTGIMGNVGDDEEGDFFINGMKGYGINTDGIMKTKWHTDVSIIPRDDKGKRGAIAFFEEAGRHFDLTSEIKKKLKALKPKIVQIAYSGLFDRGADRNGGRNLAGMIQWIKGMGSIVMVDTHTYTDKIKKYDLLKPSLMAADLFMCSNDEVELMLKRFNINCSESSDEMSKAYVFLEYLQSRFWKNVSEPRIFAVTSREFVIIKYLQPDGQVVTKNIKNYFSAIKAVDSVGAGDSFRAGFNVYISRNLKKFKNGSLNIAESVQFASLAALLYISGKGTHAFRNYTYRDLLRVVKKGEPVKTYKNIREIYSALSSKS